MKEIEEKMVYNNFHEPPSLRKYLFFLGGQVQSQLGSAIVQFVIILWIVFEYQSAFYLGLAAFTGFAPMIVVTPVAGVLVDRWNRKVVIGIVDLAQAFVTCGLVYLFWVDFVNIWWVLIVLGLRAIFQAFHMPATEAVVPLMVPREKLSRINGLREFFIGFNGIIAPMLAILLLNFWEIQIILLIDPLTFGVAVIPLLFIEFPSVSKKSKETQKSSFKTEFVEGLAIIFKRPGLLPLVILFALANLFLQPLNVLLPLYILKDHSRGKEDLAIILVFLQVGYFLGSIFMMFWKGFEHKIGVVVLSSFGTYVGIFLIAFAPINTNSTIIIIGLGNFIIGLLLALLNTTIMTLYQTIIPPEKYGRFTSTRRTLIWFTIPVGSILSGIVAEIIAIQTLFYLCAFLGIITVMYFWFFTKLPEIEKLAQIEVSSSTAKESVTLSG